MNSGEEDVDSDVIGEIVRNAITQLNIKGHQHHGDSTQGSRRLVRREIHREIRGFGFGSSSNGILPSRESNLNVIQLLMDQNQRFDRFDRRLERSAIENDELRNRISGLERENTELKATATELRATVSRLEGKITLFEQDIKGLLDKEAERVFKE